MTTKIAALHKKRWSGASDSWRTWDNFIKALIPFGVFLLFGYAWKIGGFCGYARLLKQIASGYWMFALGAGYTMAYLGFMLARTWLWLQYKPYPVPPGPLPKVTVIIPAYNEGGMVEKALYSVAASDYPAECLEIICIDDGSRDDTWDYIERAARRYPGLIESIRFPQNRGKREALYAGFTRGSGEYFVTVDSDSLVTPQTVKQILAPLLQDPGVGR